MSYKRDCNTHFYTAINPIINLSNRRGRTLEVIKPHERDPAMPSGCASSLSDLGIDFL